MSRMDRRPPFAKLGEEDGLCKPVEGIRSWRVEEIVQLDDDDEHDVFSSSLRFIIASTLSKNE
jgi:hypothetical protein